MDINDQQTIERKGLSSEQQEHGASGEPVSSRSGADEGVRAEGVQAADAEVERLKGEVATLQDRQLRQAAEFQNYRRRAEQERDAAAERGRSEVIRRMLDLLDDFGRSLDAAVSAEEQGNIEAAYEGLKSGVGLVHRKFLDELARLGVEPIEAVGQPFDAYVHEAVMQQPAPEGTPSGTVLSEFQKGYRFGERVLRHSKVVVAS